MRLKALAGLTALLLICTIVPISADALSYSPAMPMSVSIFDSQGNRISGNLLDERSIPVSTHTDVDSGITTYTIAANTPLMADARHLVIDPPEAGDCVLSISAARESGFITESGITFAFYEDTTYSAQSYVGEVTFTNGGSEQQNLNRLLTAGKPYYIRAWTAADYSVTDISPSSHYEIDLIFTATTGIGVNAVFYHMNDGVTRDPIASALVTNGRTYGDPPTVERAGYELLGWFSDPTLGESVHSNDVVNLTGEQHLYAHWIKEGSDVIHIYDHGNDEWIWIIVSEKTVYVKVDGKSDSSRVVTTYESYVKDGKVILETVDTAFDFTVHDADDAVEQYNVVKQVLMSRGLIVEDHIVIGHGEHVHCEEGALSELLLTDCDDIRVIGDDLTISMNRGILETLKDLTGEIVIDDFIIPDDVLTKEEKDRIGDHIAFDIDIINHGEEITEFNGTFTIWFPYEAPEGVTDPRVYCVKADGSIEEMPTTYEDGIITFKTHHLSIYYVSDGEEKDDNGTNWLIPVIIVSISAAVLLTAALLVRKKMQKRRCSE